MTRYYTEDAYNQIKQTIEQIDNADVSPVKDFFSDLFLRLGQFLKIYSVDQYQYDMQNWYNKVLDSHNSTMRTVENIFNDVDNVDLEYCGLMNGALESIVSFQKTLNCLRDVISGKISLADGKSAADGYLTAGKDSLKSACDTILTKMEARNRREASLELIGDLLKLGAAFTGLFAIKDPVKWAVSGKKFVDTFAATLLDSAAILTCLEPTLSGVVPGVDRKDLIDYRFNKLTEAQNYKDTNSVSDWLGGMAEDAEENLADCPENSPFYPITKLIAAGSRIVSNTSDIVDTAADVYDIASDIKDSRNTIDEWMHGKNYTSGELVEKYEFEKKLYIYEITDSEDGPIYRAKLPSKDIISKLISDRTGIPLSGWDDPAKIDNNAWKTAGTLWSYTEKFLPDPATGRSNTSELPDVFWGNFKETSFLKDVFDFALDNFITEVS